MKTKLIAIVFTSIGIIIGIIFTAISIHLSAGKMMIKEMKSPYDFEKTIEMLSTRINSKPGWHVSNIIDQQEELVKNGGAKIGKYKIIQYCNAKYSSEMLSTDNRKTMGVMMPKSFAVYENEYGQVFIATINGAAMGKMLGGEKAKIIEKVSREVEQILSFINHK